MQSPDNYAPIGEFVQGKHASSGECGINTKNVGKAAGRGALGIGAGGAIGMLATGFAGAAAAAVVGPLLCVPIYFWARNALLSNQFPCVGRKHIVGIEFPVGHPVNNTVYIAHPSGARKYFSLAEFHRSISV